MSRRQSITLPANLLKGLTLERLQELVDKDEEFNAFFSQLELDEVKRIQRNRDEITNSNRELSLENTLRKPIYESKKARLIDTSLNARQLKETYDRKYRELQIMSGAADKSEIQKNLQTSSKESERESDELADNYLSGTSNMSSDEFINQYLSSRTTYWLRKVKSEKMDEITRRPLPYQSKPTSMTPVPSQAPPYPIGSPTYESIKPLHSLPPSYNSPPTHAAPTASMPVPRYPPTSGAYPPPSYPQASYRPPPPNMSYRPAPPPNHSYRHPPPPVGQSYRAPPIGQSIYQQVPYSYRPPYSGYNPHR